MKSEDPIPIGKYVVISRRGKRKIWTASFRYRGEHCRRSLQTTNERVARQRAAKIENELHVNLYQPQIRSATLADGVRLYLEYVDLQGRAKATKRKYSAILQRFCSLAEEFGVARLDQFTPSHFDRYLRHRSQTVDVETLHDDAVLIKQLFKWAKSRQLVAANPIDDYKLEEPRPKPKTAPDRQQIAMVLANSKGQLHSILKVLACSGMRIGELKHLRPEHVDLDRGWISIVSTSEHPTKTGLEWKVPIHPAIRSILSDLVSNGRPYVFTAEASDQYPAGNHQVTEKKINERFKRLLKRLGLPAGRNGGFVVHSLRSSFKTICINDGVPERMVDRWQGHRGADTMARIYYRPTDEDQQQKMRQVRFELPVKADEEHE